MRGQALSCAVSILAMAMLCCLPQATRAAVQVPGQTIEAVDFERHVMGVFGRLGCNSGSCHGSFQGKNGFRLSLFGYEPAKDYLASTRDQEGRRINPVDADQSLLLLKATGQIPHGGGPRFAKDSWQYQLLREWIAQGAPWHKGSGDLTALKVVPPEFEFKQIGASMATHVRAHFADGSVEEVTALCDFRIQNDALAEVSPLGEVQALRPGDTALVIHYRGNVQAVRILVPRPAPPDARYPDVPEANYIDREVFAKLRRLRIIPSDVSQDMEFLRRLTIDTVGCLPSPDELRAFLADKDPRKRAKKIDGLLAHPMHAALWATRFSDITGNNTDLLAQGGRPIPAQKYSQMWHDWFRKRLADNVPYDEIVRGVLCATSRDTETPQEWLKEVKHLEEEAKQAFHSSYAERPSLDLYWRLGRAPTLESLGERTAAAFLGVRLECAQCHKHPFDRWTQADYRAYANVFGQVALGISPECKQAVNEETATAGPKGKAVNKDLRFSEVFVGLKARALPHPDADALRKPVVKGKGKAPGTPMVGLPPKALGGSLIPIDKGQDARAHLFEWMRSADNPYFARSFVNRVWAHYFGVGLVEPVDNFSQANPPSNQKLLDLLAKDFISHGFDIRCLERTILNSRAYQLSSTTNDSNQDDRTNYSYSYLRPMMAEVVVDVLDSALGVEEDWKNDAPPGTRAIEIGASRVQNGNLAYIFRTFGRSPRTATCDCERALEPALPQTLYLMTDASVLQRLQASARPLGKGAAPGAKEGRLALLLKSGKSNADILADLFLATLARYPTASEKQAFEAYFQQKEKEAPAFFQKAKMKSVPPETRRLSAEKVNSQKKTIDGQRLREVVFLDTLWALINTREFILNH